jgi:hypothetical protein
VHLSDADLSGADLTGADLTGAHLPGAYLSGANFSETNLTEADLRDADLTGANFHGALLYNTTFANIDLSTVNGLDSVRHERPSSISTDTLIKSKGNIPESFLRGCGVPDAWIDYLPSLIGAMEPIQFYSCFISYSHKDEDFAQRLYERMQSHHLRVWFAPEDMKGGQKLHEQIDQAIRIHDKLVLVLSDHSIQSEWVMTEIRKARKAELRDNRRKLFPIRLVDMETIRDWECFDADTGKDLAVEVREYFIPDFTRWKDHDAFERAFGRFLKDLQAVETPPVPRPAEPPKPGSASKTMPQNPHTVIARKKRRLEVLEERQAIMGISTPPEVVTEIEDLQREIGELEGD